MGMQASCLLDIHFMITSRFISQRELHLSAHMHNDAQDPFPPNNVPITHCLELYAMHAIKNVNVKLG